MNDNEDKEGSGATGSAIELGISVVIPFAQFVPLIKDIAEIVNKVNELYSTAQHNKQITNLLKERISTVYSTVINLQDDSLYTVNHYSSLQRLVQVLQRMKKYIDEITQYNTVQKFLGSKTLESQFNDLCKEYDSSVNTLSLSLQHNLIVDFKINKINRENEQRTLREDIEDLREFQSALAERIHDEATEMNKEVIGKIDNLDQKVSDEMNALVEKVSDMAITMQTLDEKGVNQKKIDNIFHESLLPFNDYVEADEKSRSDKLRKYLGVKTQQEFAFKTVNQKEFNQVKNQVTILKKLKDFQNIIDFYGLTYDGSKYYLVTEWAENGNLREYINSRGQDITIKLRIRLAYDIAKGLNFLNTVMYVHRDIRAENIVITLHDVAKITNFKSSRAFEAESTTLNVNKDIRYSSPEILRRGMTGEDVEKKKYQKYDTKCEVYSFGILLWEIAECRAPYVGSDDFMEVTKKVLSGYREPFIPNTAIPVKYQELVTKAVNQNPGHRPTFAKMLTDLRDIFNNYNPEKHTPPKKPPVPPPKRQDSGCIINWASFNYMTIDKAIIEHKKENVDKSILYKCFDAYAKMDNLKAKQWKAYYIIKGWSDLTCSKEEKNEISAKLFKEAADCGDEYPEAQLRIGIMLMGGRGVNQNKDEAIEYFRKAANNDHVVAMFNLATYYLSANNDELGKYYMIMAADKGYDQAINYCKENKFFN